MRPQSNIKCFHHIIRELQNIPYQPSLIWTWDLVRSLLKPLLQNKVSYVQINVIISRYCTKFWNNKTGDSLLTFTQFSVGSACSKRCTIIIFKFIKVFLSIHVTFNNPVCWLVSNLFGDNTTNLHIFITTVS